MGFLETVGLLDAIFIGILVISVIVGLIRGGVREILSLVGLALAIYCALTFSEALSNQYVSQFFEQPRVSYIITFALIIIGVLFSVALVNLLISQLLKASGLSFLNRFFGMLFGIVRGALICCIVVFVLGFIPGVAEKNWWKVSTTVPIFKVITKELLTYLPKEIADYFEASKDEVGKLTERLAPTAEGGDATEATSNTSGTATRPDPLAEKMQAIDEQNKPVDSETQKAILNSIAEDAPAINLESASEGNSASAPDNPAVTPNTENAENTDKAELILESYSQ